MKKKLQSFVTGFISYKLIKAFIKLINNSPTYYNQTDTTRSR